MKRKRGGEDREHSFRSVPCVNSPLCSSAEPTFLSLFKSRSSCGLKGDLEPLMPGNKRETLYCREPFMSLKLTRCRKRKRETERLQWEGDGVRRKTEGGREVLPGLLFVIAAPCFVE